MALGRVPPSQHAVHAGTVPGGRVPVPGQVRLLQRRRGRGRRRRRCSAATCSASTRTRRPMSCRLTAVTPLPAGLPAGPRGARGQHGDRAQRGLGLRRPRRASASTSSAAAWSAAWSPSCARRLPGAEVTLADIDARAGRARRGAGRDVRAAGGTGRRRRPCHPCQRPSRSGCGTALAVAGLRGADRRAELVRQRRGGLLPLGEAFHSRRLRLEHRRWARWRRTCARAGATPAAWPRRWTCCAPACSTA